MNTAENQILSKQNPTDEQFKIHSLEKPLTLGLMKALPAIESNKPLTQLQYAEIVNEYALELDDR